jgi:hypothetical protein
MTISQRAEEDREHGEARGGPGDDGDARGHREQPGDDVGGLPVDPGGQQRPEALEDEQGSDEDGEAADAPVDAEDQDAGEDQQQAVEQHPGPVAGKALGGGVGELAAERVE